MTNNCDTKTGFCAIEPIAEYTPLKLEFTKPTLIYVGDPMCSWCWGIAPELEKLQAFAKAQNIDYKIMLGGLRPFGGDAWNKAFKDFLLHHWQEVAERTGQTFDHKFLERENFNYITEPACRAVVIMRHLLKATNQGEENLSKYFGKVQQAFFAKNTDPTDAENLAKIAELFGIAQDEFIQAFNDETAKQATLAEFSLVQNLGVQGFPSVIFIDQQQITPIAKGYASAKDMQTRLEKII